MSIRTTVHACIYKYDMQGKSSMEITCENRYRYHIILIFAFHFILSLSIFHVFEHEYLHPRNHVQCNSAHMQEKRNEKY